ncbi:MAG: hypothetical protein KJ000_24550 [Pirellulaceae bacterium]|nr:hypothetical protein [Pirellulaceae bacterium]
MAVRTTLFGLGRRSDVRGASGHALKGGAADAEADAGGQVKNLDRSAVAEQFATFRSAAQPIRAVLVDLDSGMCAGDRVLVGQDDLVVIGAPDRQAPRQIDFVGLAIRMTHVQQQAAGTGRAVLGAGGLRHAMLLHPRPSNRGQRSSCQWNAAIKAAQVASNRITR